MLEWIIWHITNRCNLTCSYCYTSSGPASEDGLSFNQRMQVVDQINRSKAKLVTIIGGEPFVIPELPLIVEKLLEVPDREINIDTNGTLLKARWSDVYKYVNRINVGIDATDPDLHNTQRGGFDKVIEAIHFLREKGVSFSGSITVTSWNYDTITDTAGFLLNNGAKVIGFGKVKPIGRGLRSDLVLSQEQHDIAVEQIVGFYQQHHGIVQILASGFYAPALFEKGPVSKLPFCMCADNKVTVSFDGTAYPCEIIPFLFTKDDFVSEFGPLLNLLDTTLEEIMRSQLMQFWRKVVYTRPIECKDCRFRLYCNGGCRALNYFLTRNSSRRDPQCKL